MSHKGTRTVDPKVAAVLRAAARRDGPLVKRIDWAVDRLPEGSWLGTRAWLEATFDCKEDPMSSALYQLRDRGRLVKLKNTRGAWHTAGAKSNSERVAEAVHSLRVAAGRDGSLGSGPQIAEAVGYPKGVVTREIRSLEAKGRIERRGWEYHNVGEPEQRA